MTGIQPSALERAAEFVAQEEGVARKPKGPLGVLLLWAAALASVFHLYTAWGIVPAQTLRPVHVALIVALSFLFFPLAGRFRARIQAWDWLAAAAALACAAYLILGGEDVTDRASLPNQTDMALGLVLIALVLEATRRSTGWIMPVVALIFLAYALGGQHLPPPWTHRGYELDRLVGHLWLTLEGIFGPAVDVASSLIVLFAIFGAVLDHSGAGRFFVDFSFRIMGGKRASAGRAVVMSSFLLGGPSGSGVATTVTVGSVAYPMLARAGYGANAAGGLLAAGGLGAIISPPVLGAAAFLIAEFLKISYLDVVRMAAVPTILFYFALLVMVEIDARRHGGASDPMDMGTATSTWALVRAHGFHFASLISIVALLLLGFSATLAVFYATLLAIAASFLSREDALVPPKLLRALANGTTGVLGVAATCAAAGIIVGVVTLTGLGLKFSSIAVAAAGGSVVLTAVYTALIVWVVGLAVPVTASYIICAVIAAPALTQLGVPDYAAHMFIFYYAVLSEVSPPTALSPFAAAALTGGNPYVTTLQAWKYTLPAFLVPFVFVLDPAGAGLLLEKPGAGWWAGIGAIVTTTIGIAAYAAAAQGWALRRLTKPARWTLAAAGTLLLFPAVIDAASETFVAEHQAIAKMIGVILAVAAIAPQAVRRRATP